MDKPGEAPRKGELNVAPSTRCFRLVSCEIFHREMCLAVSRTPNLVDVAFLPKGLHDIGHERMLQAVQAAVDATEPGKYEAVIMGYALCNNGLSGLVARDLPLVVPKAHDCITMFMGSRKRYEDYFFKHPGVYFMTTGWAERNTLGTELRQVSIQKETGMDLTYEEMVEKYGEDNAVFLFEQLGDHTRHYGQFTYIEMGVGPDEQIRERTRAQASERGWAFETMPGDMTMIQRLVDGHWNSGEFLVVPPRHRVVTTFDDEVIRAEPVE